MTGDVLLEVEDLKVHFPVRLSGVLRPKTAHLKAVDGISFTLAAGQTLGIVGESGCGKSTLGRAVLHLLPPTAGRVLWLGEDLGALDRLSLRRRRRDLQLVFQDPLASLDPRMTVGDSIAEPLRAFHPDKPKAEIAREVKSMMERVGLLPDMANRYPHEFSGGQCQRISIARAMILRPKLVVLDEPVSALDVSIQAQIINLLKRLQAEFALSYIFISHDLSVVRHMCDRVLVMYLGQMMEQAPAAALFRAPRHPYTQSLISAVPIPDPKLERAKADFVLSGDIPSPLFPPSGCRFRTRCPHARSACAERRPGLEAVAPDHEVACHYWPSLGPVAPAVTGPDQG